MSSDEAFIEQYFSPPPEQLGGPGMGQNQADRARALAAQQAVREVILRNRLKMLQLQPGAQPQMQPMPAPMPQRPMMGAPPQMQNGTSPLLAPGNVRM